MTNENSIGIHFLDLDDRERGIFDRIITFNGAQGIKTHAVETTEDADLVVLSEAAVNQVEDYSSKIILIVLSNDDSCIAGDIQIKRPLLITKVMKSLGDAIDLVNAKLVELEANTEAKISDNEDDVVENTTEITADKVVVKDQNTEVLTEEVAVENNVTELVTAELDNSNDQSSGHHALVIDDSAAIRKQLELELRDAGISSDFAESGEIALEKVKDNHFDLIFLDIIMPGIDGYETCKAMRKTAELKRTPIIMLSGKTSPLDEVEGVIAGATTYLTKPVKSDKLQETLNRVTKWIDNFAVTKTVETA